MQRKCKRKLDRGEPSSGMTAARAAKLDKLGFVWELSAAAISIQNSKSAVDDVRWEAQLAKLKVYKRRHGDCSVPKRWAEDPTLGNWVNAQRRLKRNLDRGEPGEGMTAERAAKLTALGLSWSPFPKARGASHPNEAAWEAQLARLAAYKAAHGDCNVPYRWAEDPKLGTWVMNQRKCKRKLDRGEPSEGMTAARAAKLEALGFVWELSAAAISIQNSKAAFDDAGWEAQLAKLKVYKRRQGDCSVPQGWVEDPRLGNWVKHQRAYKRKLDRGDPSPGMTVERAAKLDALGFAWQTLAARRRPAAGVGSGVGAKRKRSAAVMEGPAGRRRGLGRRSRRR
jgi:hypothetical protein